MRNIDSGTLEAIGRGEYAHAWLLLFDLSEGLFGFWPGAGTLNISGVNYTGAGSLLTIEQIDMGVDLSASPLTVSLRAVPESSLTPDVLATIDTYGYKNRPARLSLAYFNPVTGAVVTVIPWWQGYIDVVDHQEQIGLEYKLVARLEPRSLDHSRIGYRMRSDADQRLIDADDAFFEHAATTPTEQLPYGRSEDGTLQKQSTSGGADGK